jgi:hypothetical protein
MLFQSKTTMDQHLVKFKLQLIFLLVLILIIIQMAQWIQDVILEACIKMLFFLAIFDKIK